MAKFSSIVTNANLAPFAHSTFPTPRLCAALSLAQRAALTDREIAAGWPTDIRDRALRLRDRRDVFISPFCWFWGRAPIPVDANSGQYAEWVELSSCDIFSSDECGLPPFGWAADNVLIPGAAAAVDTEWLLAGRLDSAAADGALAARFVRRFLGEGLIIENCRKVGHTEIGSGWRQYGRLDDNVVRLVITMPSSRAADCIYHSVAFDDGAPNSLCYSLVVEVAQDVRLAGLSSMWLAPLYGNLSGHIRWDLSGGFAEATDAYGFRPQIQAIRGDAGWADLLETRGWAIQRATVANDGVLPRYWSQPYAISNVGRREAIGATYEVTTLPDLVAGRPMPGSGPGRYGFQQVQGTLFGDIPAATGACWEFENGALKRYTTTWPYSAVMSTANLAAATAEQKAALLDTVVKTTYDAVTQKVAPSLVRNTKLYRLMDAAEMDMKDELMIAKTDSTPAMTYEQVEAKAIGKSRNLRHALLRPFVNIGDEGSVSVAFANGYDATGGVDIANPGGISDLDIMFMAALESGIVNSTTLSWAGLRAEIALALNLPDDINEIISHRRKAHAAILEFSEVAAYRAGPVDIAAKRSVDAALTLVEYAGSREALDSVVVGGAVLVRSALK